MSTLLRGRGKKGSSRVVRASGCQCHSRNSPGFNPSILRHSEIWGAADEAVLNNVHNKKKEYKNHLFLVFLIKTHNTYHYRRQPIQHFLDKQKKNWNFFLLKQESNCTPSYAYYMYSQKILAWYILNSFLLPPELPILSTPSEPTWNHRELATMKATTWYRIYKVILFCNDVQKSTAWCVKQTIMQFFLGSAIISLVGFDRAKRPCAARTRLFMLIKTGRWPTPSSL